jgi:DUF1680 family protein
MMYLCCGAADVYAETGDPALLEALERLWRQMTARRIYVTGGLGARYEGEAFGKDYELPGDRAYAESCAAIGSVMWCWRMLLITGDARYADLMETTLLNAVLPGWGAGGTDYFYQNPLADDGAHRRQGWFGCACCPPNIARLIAQIPGYFYAVAPGTATVALYARGRADLQLPGGPDLAIDVDTDYPWQGRIVLTITPDTASRFSLRLRIPGWARGASIAVGGEPYPVPEPGAFAEIEREWIGPTVVELDLPMPVERIEAHPWLTSSRGSIAVARGPVLYALEAADHPAVDVRDLAMTSDTVLEPQWTDELGGVMLLKGAGVVQVRDGWEGRLYRRAARGSATSPSPLTFVPYFAWANRSPGPMAVWIPVTH